MSDIRRDRTAANRKKPSVPVRWAHNQGVIRSAVFDWGCGRGRDSIWLEENGLEVFSYDPYFDDALTPDCLDFDLIKTTLLIDVLNVIEDREERNGLISDVGSLTKKDSMIIVSVPRSKTVEKKASKSKWDSYADGFVTKNKTFMKGYTLGDFADSCMKMGSLIHVKKLKTSLIGVVRSE